MMITIYILIDDLLSSYPNLLIEGMIKVETAKNAVKKFFENSRVYADYKFSMLITMKF